MKIFGVIVFGFLIGLVYAWVSWVLWGWFAVPLGMPSISFWYAFGLYNLAASVLLWSLHVPQETGSLEWAVRSAVTKMLVALVILLEGWVVHQFLL